MQCGIQLQTSKSHHTFSKGHFPFNQKFQNFRNWNKFLGKFLENPEIEISENKPFNRKFWKESQMANEISEKFGIPRKLILFSGYPEIGILLPDLPANKECFWRQYIKTKMAAEVPKWMVSAQRDLTASKTEEQKEKTKTKNQKRKEARKRRVERKREAKLAKLLMGIQERADKVQVDMRELIEAEKQKSEKFLSLARKYYGMWKTLNGKCQEMGAWKSPRSQVQYFTSNVSFSVSRS